MSTAELDVPPSWVPPRVPRSVIPPDGVHRNAWPSPAAVSAFPATRPRALIPCATLYVPPRVPRSVIPPDGVHRNALPPPHTFHGRPTGRPRARSSCAPLYVPP